MMSRSRLFHYAVFLHGRVRKTGYLYFAQLLLASYGFYAYYLYSHEFLAFQLGVLMAIGAVVSTPLFQDLWRWLNKK